MILRYKHLEGREFVHGKTDCYGIIRDFYRDNFDIHLTNYARPDEWWNKGMNLYLDNFHREGFRVVDIPINQARPADLLLVCVRTRVPCHAGIYLGEGRVLHHLIGRRSEVSLAKGLWHNALSCIIRHKDVPDLTAEPAGKLELIDLIPAHKRRQLEEAMKNAGTA